ncbi:MAG TPA: hypothetical protein VJ930_07200 [Acidimicrobiia bacterium]|nr:hypothetical protein [Acidimicrobiia bacterium]
MAASASVLWAAFWGLVSWNVFTDNVGPGAVIGGLASVVAAILPGAMLVLQKRASSAPQELAPKLEIPDALRPAYRRLLGAHEQARNLVAEGVIEQRVLRGVAERIEEVIGLLSADVSNEELGGRPSARLREEVEELTELLVGLADAALDRRTAALDSDNQAAAALREALGRMRAEEQGFRELGRLEGDR